MQISNYFFQKYIVLHFKGQVLNNFSHLDLLKLTFAKLIL